MRTFFGLLLLATTLAARPLAAQAPAAPPQTDSSAWAALTLQPGDLVRVTVWREPDLSGEFQVDPDGVVTLPMIGPQTVAGVPLRQLRNRLVGLYQANLRNPSINIVPLRRVNVLGEVQKPGMYPVDPTVSLAGVVAMAGGATGWGRLDRIRILRGTTVLLERADAAQTLNSAGIRSNDQIVVERRSWLDRNSATVLASGLSVLATIITTAIIVNR
ncbi:MAG TPA: polysaccharide biosynthesis/export family protein [Longimicrobium sp.]